MLIKMFLFLFLPPPPFSEVIISLVLSGCLLFLLIILLLGIICYQKEPLSSQRYQKVINEEVGEDS